MLDEKTTEPQQEMPSAPKPTARRGEKLRSLWARLQCVHLLRRHRFRRKTQHHMNNVSQKMRATPWCRPWARACTLWAFRRNMPSSAPGGGSARQPCGWRPWFAALAHDLMVTAFPGAAQVLKDLFGPIVLFVRGCGALLVHAHRIHQEKGLGAALQASVHFFTNGIRRNVKLLPRMAMYILPLCALAVWVAVFNHMVYQPYALAVQVNGQTVGYVGQRDGL